MFDDYDNNLNGESNEPTNKDNNQQDNSPIGTDNFSSASQEPQSTPNYSYDNAQAAPANENPQQQNYSQPTYGTEPEQPENSQQADIPYAQTERVDENADRNSYYSQNPQENGSFYSQQNNQYQQYQQPGYDQNNYGQPPVKQKKPKKAGVKIFAAVIAVILVFALGVGSATIFKEKDNKTGTESSTTGDTAQLTINESPTSSNAKSDGTVLTPAQIAAKVRASNVGIVVYASNSTSASGEGSGVIMGEDSTGNYTYIITCAHVISDTGIKATVQTEDGESYDAEIVGFDTRTDLGVLKIKKTGLQAAEFGDSDALSIGDPVYAVGNPGGVEFFGSFTGGYISAINRPVSSEIGYTMKCIQHDASINPGNSGGMLVNQYGQVIGINSQKIASTEYEGMGFAIPISSAQEIINDLIKYSYVPDRPKLGITYYPVSASTQYNMIAQIKGLPTGTLIINSISSDSSLYNSKAKQYDMITKVNGKELTTADVLLELIDDGKVGDKLTLTLCRVSSDYSIETFDVEVTLVEDKGDTQETTTTQTVDPFEYFYNYGNGSGNGSSDDGSSFGY